MQNNEVDNKIKLNFSDYFIAVAIILCFLLGVFKFSIIELSENQVLYLFSTSSQVIAGLFGLTLAGYAFINDKLEKETSNDETVYDAVEGLRKIYYKMIKRMAIICMLSIFLCLFNISSYNIPNIPSGTNIFIINLTMSLVLSEIIYIVEFIIKIADPNKIVKIIKELNTEKEDGIEEKGDLVEFLKTYNSLESLMINFSQELTFDYKNTKDFKNKNVYKPQIFQALNILMHEEIISKCLFYRIDEIRRYRNYVVHGKDLEVSKNMCESISEIYKTVSNSIEKYKAKV